MDLRQSPPGEKREPETHNMRPAVPVLSSFWRHRQLILQMTRREILGRYRGSLFGLAWSLVTPFVMLTVYTFLFGTIFRARWGFGPSEGRVDYALILFVGLIVHG